MFFLVGAVAVRAIARATLQDAWLGDDPTGWRNALESRLSVLAMLAGFLLVALDLARLWLQTYGFFGGFEPITVELIGTIAHGTLWGSGWKLQATSAAAAAVAFAAAYRAIRGAWAFAAVVTVLTTISRPLTGHAVEQGSWLSLPAILQMIHVSAAAAWIGTLAVLVFVGIRHAAPLAHPGRAKAVAAMVSGFSPIAVSAVTCLFIAGTATSFMYLGSATALFGTDYGLTLLAKVGLFAAVAAIGFFNWQRVRPALDAVALEEGSDDGGSGLPEALLMRSARLELGIAIVVLLVTAALVVMPMPMG